MPDVISVLVGGSEFYGWERVNIERSLEALSGSFSLDCTIERPFPIKAGAECEVRLNGVAVITGFVDAIGISMETYGVSYGLSGRDKTSDLVDCSVTNASQEVKMVTVKAALEMICAPFGIAVSYNAPSYTLQRFGFHQETAGECIDRMCRAFGLLAHGLPNGTLVIEPIGAKRASTGIVQGVNVKSASANYDYSGRFSEYLVYGQTSGNDTVNASYSAHNKGRAADTGISRRRPLIILAEGAADSKICASRAQWEASVRAARSETLSVTVQGWGMVEGGAPWMPNSLVRCDIGTLGVSGDFLIKSVRFSVDASSGTETGLELVRKDAYKLEPSVSKSGISDALY